MGGFGHIFVRLQNVATMLGVGVGVSLISGYGVDKASWQSQFVVKLRIANSALNSDDFGIGGNPESSIAIFAHCFKTGIRQTGANREALDQVTFPVEQVNAAILNQDGQIFAQDPSGIEYRRTF